ncbi:MAG TPA: family 43 glycosylhydrolase, partial [Prolixibacteraceae bacterium]|nr:family 43 glycosylhydrolase [Prolixibacteraceae bacterium]
HYDGHRAIRIQEFDTKTDKTFGPRKVIVNGGVHPEEKPIWIEGPHLYKINGKYFLMAAEGGTGPNHSEVIFRSEAPMGEFKPWNRNPILTQRHLDPKRPNPVTCAGHADLIQTQKGDWWAVFLACRPINNDFENLGRETFMMPVKWSEDGFPYMTQGDDLIPLIQQKDGTQRASRVTFGNFESNDNFDFARLGYEWMTLRTPATDLYSLEEVPGYLTLKCADVSASEKKTPAYVCRRLQHHQFECTTKIYFQPADEKEAAGLLLYKDETHQYFLSVCKSAEGRKICLNKISDSPVETLASASMMDNTSPIMLKVVSTGIYYDFYYATDDKFWKLLTDHVDARYLSTANSFGFTGTTIGMYATKKL